MSVSVVTECDVPLRELREALWHHFVIISCVIKPRILNDEAFACVFMRVGACSVSQHSEQSCHTRNKSK